MTLDEYQNKAQRTSNTFTKSSKIENGILGLVGETGECADLLKKYYYQGHELNTGALIEELGDVLWYVAELARGLDVTLETVATKNIEKLQARYPLGFDTDRSVNRD